jgi:hypothetical protein
MARSYQPPFARMRSIRAEMTPVTPVRASAPVVPPLVPASAPLPKPVPVVPKPVPEPVVVVPEPVVVVPEPVAAPEPEATSAPAWDAQMGKAKLLAIAIGLGLTDLSMDTRKSDIVAALEKATQK